MSTAQGTATGCGDRLRGQAFAPAIRERHDSAISAQWRMGWTIRQIGRHLGVSTTYVRNRAKALGLPARPHGWRQIHHGLTPEQLEAMRVFIRNGYRAVEARAAVLQAAA